MVQAFQSVPLHCRHEAAPTARRSQLAVSGFAAQEAFAAFVGRDRAAGPRPDEVARAIADALVDVITYAPGHALPMLTQSSAQVPLVLEGWVLNSHILPDGACQITDILLPGDFYDLAPKNAREIGHEVRACGRVRLALLRRHALASGDLPELRRIWERNRDVEAARLRSRLISLGRRDAYGRMAHLLSELHQRLGRVGLVDGGSFTCPLTQEQLADLLGLTSVHVNRVLQRLRSEGLIVFNRRRVTIPALDRLHAAAAFDGDLPDARGAAA